MTGTATNHTASTVALDGPLPNDQCVILLVDWDSTSSQDDNTIADVATLSAKARATGQLTIARAYADWSRPTLHETARQLVDADLELVLVLSESNVSASFVRLIIDAVRLSEDVNGGATFILCTDDRRVGPLNQYLRSRGNRIHLVQFGSAVEREEASTPTDTTSSFSIVFDWIRETIEREGYRGSMAFNALGSSLADRYGFHVQERFGPSMKFSTLLQMAERSGIVRVVHDKSGQLWAELTTDVAPASHEQTEEPFDDDPLGHLTPQDSEDLFNFLGSVAGTEETDANLSLDDLASLIMNNVILPDHSFEQVVDLLHWMAENGVLTRHGDEMGDDFDIFTLNKDHDLVENPPWRTLPANGFAFVTRGGELRTEFAELPLALAEAKETAGYGFISAVQAALENRLGQTLRELGYSRSMAFFQDAMRMGVVRLWRAPDGADLVLAVDESPPSSTEYEVGRAVLSKLGQDGLSTVIQTIAACEDALECVTKFASIVRQARAVLRSSGGPSINASQANRLMKRELLQEGITSTVSIKVPHSVTRQPYSMQAYCLERDHPTVMAALAQGSIELDPDIEIRCYERL